MGTGRFIAAKTIEVKLNDGGTRVLTGDRVALNLGTHATIPDIPGLSTDREDDVHLGLDDFRRQWSNSGGIAFCGP